MVGPLTDVNPNFANYNRELIDYNKFKKFLVVILMFIIIGIIK